MNNAQSQAATQASNRALQGLAKFDLVLTSTLSTDLTVELFNFDFSQLKVFNPNIQKAPQQQYHPIGVTGSPIIFQTGQANNFVLGFAMGGFDAFVSNAGTPPNNFNSNAYCFFNEVGQAVWQPGYVAGQLDPGSVTVDSLQTNYKHVWETMGKASMNVQFSKINVLSTYQQQLTQQYTYLQTNIVAAANSVPFTPNTFVSENQNQLNIITFPVNKEINPKTGFAYTVMAQQNGVPNVVNMSIFFNPISRNLLNLI